MKMQFRADRPTIVVGSTLGLVLLVLLYLVLHFWFLRQEFADEIESIQPRTARLLGIEESVEQLDRASTQARNTLAELVYPAEQDSAITSADLQQKIRELMTDAGLSVSGSQVLPGRKSESFDRLSLDITAEGSIDALEEALSNLETMRPLVIVESLKIQPKRARVRRAYHGAQRQPEHTGDDDPRHLSARFQLFSLRLKD